MTDDDAEKLWSPDAKPVTPKDRTEGIFGKKTKPSEITLQEVLDHYNISEEELRKIIRTYKSGETISVTQTIAQKQKMASEEAQKVIKNAKELKQDKVEVHDVHTAEELVNLGWVVETVRSPKGNSPKAWVLNR
jgi:hypothetical protein